MSALVELEDVTKVYRSGTAEVRALDGVSLSVRAGEFVAVQGQSGSGKTTLLLIAGGLLAPTSGTVRVDGQNPYEMTAEARARFRAATIGFVFQFHLVPYLTVRENILTAALATDRPDAAARADELIERFGLGQRAHHVPGQLSTGERQRTALARALMNQPKLLLADEPTGNLDRENTDIVLGYLADFADSGGAVLLVTHDDQAAARAQRAVRLDYGRLVRPAETAPAEAEQ
ncbi:MAG: ABC transporter ATP-binding protein [Planctomycetes bacterium]|nr:ABC transporter ATP-binding protein [Planctomycetota bacterium]